MQRLQTLSNSGLVTCTGDRDFPVAEDLTHFSTEMSASGINDVFRFLDVSRWNPSSKSVRYPKVVTIFRLLIRLGGKGFYGTSKYSNCR